MPREPSVTKPRPRKGTTDQQYPRRVEGKYDANAPKGPNILARGTALGRLARNTTKPCKGATIERPDRHEEHIARKGRNHPRVPTLGRTEFADSTACSFTRQWEAPAAEGGVEGVLWARGMGIDIVKKHAMPVNTNPDD